MNWHPQHKQWAGQGQSQGHGMGCCATCLSQLCASLGLPALKVLMSTPKPNPMLYSHSCHLGQVCHRHRVFPGRKERQSEEPPTRAVMGSQLLLMSPRRAGTKCRGTVQNVSLQQDMSPWHTGLLLTGIPGGPNGPIVPGGPCSPRSPGSPCKDRRRGEAQGSNRTQPLLREVRAQPGMVAWHGMGDETEASCPQQEKNALPHSQEILTSRPGSPCFPGSPCR